jgi:uncharacterized membrane protein YhaH (DUF805 family)
MLSAYKSYFKNYININDSASRSEFWYVFIPNTIISLLLQLMARFVSDAQLLYVVFGLVTLVPNITLGVRRLHDIGKRGWWLLISFIPLIGGIWLIILMAKEGDHGNNAFGPDPKA